MKIAIVGGGIVGLTTALSLHKVGFKPTVFEAVPSPAPLGVGINLLPHATRELAELGLLEGILKFGVPINELIYRVADGREVWREPRGLAAGYDWPQVAVHRGRLQMFLVEQVKEALGPDAIRFGHALEKFETRADAVRLEFIDRRTRSPVASVDADVVIGADGIHSVVRRRFYPHEGFPIWNGVSLFRGTTILPPGSAAPAMNWGGHSRLKFIGYPIAVDPSTKAILFNWICDLPTGRPGDRPREDWNREASPAEWIDRYRGWNWPGLDVEDVIRRSTAVYEFPMVDRDPVPCWTFDRVTLAGDAAHAMYPIGSNGATQGIIDARSLAYHLATVASAEAALQRYEVDRREATSRIVLTNRAHGPDQVLEIAHQRLSNGAADLDAAVPLEERRQIADDYKLIAGFNPETLRRRQSYTPPEG